MRHRVPSLSRVLCALAALAAPAFGAGQTWVPLVDGAGPGKPASLVLDKSKSSADGSVMELRVYGFWSESLKGADGKLYTRLSFPGLTDIDQLGAPILPAARFSLGIATDATSVKLTNTEVIDSKTLTVPLLYPQPTQEGAEVFDPTGDPGPGDSDGQPEVFTKDPVVYGLKSSWPATTVVIGKVNPVLGEALGSSLQCFPATWNPETGALKILTRVKFSFAHAGTPKPQPPCTKDKAKLLSSKFANYDLLVNQWPTNVVAYQGRYLIVTTSEFSAAMDPFVQQKKKSGFHVTLKVVAAGSTVTSIRQAIGAWYADGDPADDHYCLLVGDVDDIPQRFKPGIGYDGGDVYSDDEYGSPFDLDLDEEVYVGRLSVDSVADLDEQIDKIIRYEDHPLSLGKYDRALLVSHKGNSSPSGFQASLETVMATNYAVDPTFLTAFGGTGPTNADVQSAINAGLGLVCYEGHGSSNAWSGWNGTSFHKNDVLALTNTLQPVVWSICCSNMNLSQDPSGTSGDCFGETWLELQDAGAVACYAATTVSWVKQNHKISQHLFEAVYDLGLTRHGQAIAWAEARAQEDWPNQNNAWMYLLLGDPAMRIRRSPPQSIVTTKPQFVQPCLSANCLDLVFEVKQPPGPPVEGALVSLWKAGPSSPTSAPQDEVLVNGYTDKLGKVHLPASPKTTGLIYYSVRDDDGLLDSGTIEVSPCANVASNQVYGAGKAGTAGVPKLVALDLPKVGQPTSIQLSNAKPGSMPVLFLGAAAASVPFAGGTLLAQPQLILPLGVPVALDGKLAIGGTLPDDATLCGVSLYHQVVFTDPGATGYYHLAMTNGLVRVFGS